ncbi:MAG TPA: WD40 repeat domain-containing protein [Armatimonadota bacterium]|nr:WD40 repeat domain-containing protein [Armatimonadota bacterium]
MWDAGTSDLLQTFSWREHVEGPPIFAYGTDGFSIIFGGTQDCGVIGLFDTAEGALKGIWPLPLPNVAAFALSPRGDLMAAGSKDGDILLWRLQPNPLDPMMANAR